MNTHIHDAATLVLWRAQPGGYAVLMGQRAAAAIFMPGKFVFPGGRVDPSDAAVPLHAPLAPACLQRLSVSADVRQGNELAVAAIRELWEETGLMIGGEAYACDGVNLPETWRNFVETGHLPDVSQLKLFFRAITPPNRPRRFDARFFIAPASAVVGDLDDFSGADLELSHLQWVPLAAASELDLPFITQIVLAELSAYLNAPDVPRPVPFFDNRSDTPRFLTL